MDPQKSNLFRQKRAVHTQSQNKTDYEIVKRQELFTSNIFHF